MLEHMEAGHTGIFGDLGAPVPDPLDFDALIVMGDPARFEAEARAGMADFNRTARRLYASFKALL